MISQWFIEAADVSKIIVCSQDYGRKILRKIKKNLNKERHQLVTVRGFCDYKGLNYDHVITNLIPLFYNKNILYINFFKRFLDVMLSLAGLIVLSPVLLLLMLFISVSFKTSPFFIQKRLGRNAHIFRIIKFKTMSNERDSAGQLLPDEQRLTSFGKFLRKTSLDELPQLINVLKGEMCMVGPRPLLPYYQTLYNDFQKRRNEVKPGITGWAQVNGRNNVDWIKRFEMDVWYVDHISFVLDLKILFLTIFKIFDFKNVNEEGHATAPDFSGNN